MTKIKIGNFQIAKHSQPFIIAEAGINHNGNLKNALKMIKIAKKCGANAIKFQTYSAIEMIANTKLEYSYKSQGKTITESMLKMFERCEFSPNEWKKIRNQCKKEKIIFLSTPQNPSDLKLLLQLKIPAIKVGSDDFTNIPLLKNFIKTKLPLIISCGMANLEEIKTILNEIGSLKNYPTILMLTTSEYPTPAKNANLLKFQTISNKFPKLILGYSDHTTDNLASSIALSLGAKVFEKHFTLNNNFAGPDHWFSLNPHELKNWIDSIHTSYSLLGSNKIQPTKNELKMRLIARRCPVALVDIKKNEIFNEKNIGLRRAGAGLNSKNFFNIVGKKSKKNIKQGKLIKKGDF